MEWTKDIDFPWRVYLLGHDGRGEELPVADAGEVEVEDDGVVDSQAHQDTYQVILPQVAFLQHAEPVTSMATVWLQQVKRERGTYRE